MYIALDKTAINSVHASQSSADARIAEAKSHGKNMAVVTKEIIGGTVNCLVESEVPKVKAAPKKAAKTEEVDDAPAKKTKPAAE